MRGTPPPACSGTLLCLHCIHTRHTCIARGNQGRKCEGERERGSEISFAVAESVQSWRKQHSTSTWEAGHWQASD